MVKTQCWAFELDVMEYFQERVRIVDEQIEKIVSRRVDIKSLADASRHLIKAGGKRLRPALTLISCEAVGGEAEDAVGVSAALELLHTFTLIHDDIMDNDEFRRGVKTVHKVWNVPTAIIAGDALFAKVFEAIAMEANNRNLPCEQVIQMLDTISKAALEICQGQALDMEFERRGEVSEQDYMKMVDYKTGALFETSAKVGALFGEGTPEEIKALAEFGRLLGVAFQIYDDFLGIYGDQEKTGKPKGSDIRDGKRTLAIIYALNSASEEDREKLLHAMRRDATENEVEEAIDVLGRSGAAKDSRSKALEIIEDAKSKLEIIPGSEAKRFLLELADFSVSREL